LQVDLADADAGLGGAVAAGSVDGEQIWAVAQEGQVHARQPGIAGRQQAAFVATDQQTAIEVDIVGLIALAPLQGGDLDLAQRGAPIARRGRGWRSAVGGSMICVVMLRRRDVRAAG
jgi:hypothetical protein